MPARCRRRCSTSAAWLCSSRMNQLSCAEDQLAGEEDRLREFLLHPGAQLDEALDRVGAEGEIGLRRQAVGVAEVDEELQRHVRLQLHRLHRLGAAVAVRIDGARVDEHEIAEMLREHALHPQQRVQPAAARGADHEHRGRRLPDRSPAAWPPSRRARCRTARRSCAAPPWCRRSGGGWPGTAPTMAAMISSATQPPSAKRSPRSSSSRITAQTAKPVERQRQAPQPAAASRRCAPPVERTARTARWRRSGTR